jgi:hypothetical protein
VRHAVSVEPRADPLAWELGHLPDEGEAVRALFFNRLEGSIGM